MIVVVLQNAWARTPRGATALRRDPMLWRRVLARSLSGKKLRHLLGDDCFDRCGVQFVNTTPEVGIGAAAKLPANLDWLRHSFWLYGAKLVIACGKQAEEATLKVWTGPMIAVPHPASRTVTKRLYQAVRKLIDTDYGERIAVRQLPGRYRRVPLEKAA